MSAALNQCKGDVMSMYVSKAKAAFAGRTRCLRCSGWNAYSDQGVPFAIVRCPDCGDAWAVGEPEESPFFKGGRLKVRKCGRLRAGCLVEKQRKARIDGFS